MVVVLNRKNFLLVAAFILAIITLACAPANNPLQQSGGSVTGSQEPVIEASPLEQTQGMWKIAAADTVTLTVTAPGANRARILFRPVAATDRYLSLKTIDAPTDRAGGKFTTEMKTVVDFAGDVWAEVFYPDGSKKETRPISLAAKGSDVAEDGAGASGGPENNESERSDRVTGGKIEKAEFKEGEPDIKITVNAPAFKLTLWQNGKEIRTYDIAIGRKEFPIVIGERKATQVIWNPDWVPPDSEWVAEAKDVEPGERIEADDPRNPLGKLKIPLGDAYLIHQAASPSDLGKLVSHGCIRLVKEDLFDLAEKIIAARKLPVSKEDIERAKAGTERMVVKLDKPLVVDINYDTLVVEGGVLHVYPDVYDRKTSTVENLRTELQSVGVDTANLNDQTLTQILKRASATEEFVVGVAELQAGQALVAGKTQPLTSQSQQKKGTAKDKQPRATRGRR